MREEVGDMEQVIRIKPHHLVDIVTSIGAGKTTFQPHPYGHAVHTVSERVWADRDALLEMALGADDICAPCVHNAEGLCEDTIDTSFRPGAPSLKREWNLMIDLRWCKRLGLSEGDRVTARAFCERLSALAGDLTDIYREVPAEMTVERQRKLAAGIQAFLG